MAAQKALELSILPDEVEGSNLDLFSYHLIIFSSSKPQRENAFCEEEAAEQVGSTVPDHFGDGPSEGPDDSEGARGRGRDSGDCE